MTDLIRSLGAHERLAAIGVGIVSVSLLLPWWGVSFAGLSRTPLSQPSFAEVAIIITLVATAYLIVRSERGPAFPRPLHAGTLIALGGIWTIALVVYRIVDRPDLGIFSNVYGPGLRYGIYIALGGAALIVLGGVRARRDELAAERVARKAGADAEPAKS